MLTKTHLSKLAVLLVLALTMTGCSISASSESSSDSIASSSDIIFSPSNSSSGEDEEEQVEQTTNLYTEDIAALTVLYMRDKNDDEFKRHITTTAQTHGINDWEQEAATYRAMGVGLKRAGVSAEEIATVPYFQNMTERSHYDLVLEGFNN